MSFSPADIAAMLRIYEADHHTGMDIERMSEEIYVYTGGYPFASFMKSEYRKEDGAFVEQQGRLLFLGFLRPIINGTGHYAVEPQTRKNIRMDVQVFYGSQELNTL